MLGAFLLTVIVYTLCRPPGQQVYGNHLIMNEALSTR